MMWGGKFKAKPKEWVIFLHNEYLSWGSFIRLTGVVNAKSLHRLKEITVEVQGRKSIGGQRDQQPWACLDQAQEWLGECSCLSTPYSLLVWVQHSKMASNTFFCVSWRLKRPLADAQFFLHITPKWRKVVQLLSRSETVLLRKLSRKDKLHLLGKPEQRLSPWHLLLQGQTLIPAQLPLWALGGAHSRAGTTGCSHRLGVWAPSQGWAPRSFQPLLSSAASLKCSICHWGCLVTRNVPFSPAIWKLAAWWEQGWRGLCCSCWHSFALVRKCLGVFNTMKIRPFVFKWGWSCCIIKII